MSTLYGAWNGELGYLVGLYAPALRARSRRADRTVVALDGSLAYLVEDFADEVVPLKCQGHSQHTGKVLEGRDRMVAMLSRATMSDAVLTGEWAVESRKTIPLEFFKYGEDALDFAEFDVVVFLRPPKPLSGGRGDPLRKSWPAPGPEMAIAMLAESGLSVACAGGPDNGFHEPAADLRGVGLKFLCGTLRRAKAILGPSSGPLHLAAMTGAPIVTWCSHVDGPSIRRRYEKDWNPWGARVEWLGSKDPDAATAVATVMEVIGG